MYSDLLYNVTQNTDERCSKMGHVWIPLTYKSMDGTTHMCSWCKKDRCPSCEKKAIRYNWSGVACSCGWWFCL